MKFADIAKPLSRSAKRVGRGIGGSGGKTAGRGTKGQGARTGKKLRPGFEGGQIPFMQRLPKQPGFTATRAKAQMITVSQLQSLSGVVTPQVLKEAGLIKDVRRAVKVVGNGKLSKKLSLDGILASRSVAEQITKLGGSINVKQTLEQPKAKGSA